MTRLTISLTLLGVPVLLAASYQLSEDPTPARVPGFHGLSLHWGDFDADGLEDVYAIANTKGSLLHNDGNGTFTDVTLARCLNGEVRVQQASWADYNNDGWLDLLLVELDGGLELWRSEGGGCFKSATAEMGLGDLEGMSSASWRDYDMDGILDLQVTGGSGHTLLHGAMEGPFTIATATPPMMGEERGARGLTARNPSAPGGVSGVTLGGGSSSVVNLPGPSGSAAGAPGTYATPCSLAVYDQATQACVNASSEPALGLLYPLSSDFNLDSNGDVHFGDGTDRTTVIQQGASASLVTTDGGGTLYLQSGTDLTPGSTARVFFTGMGGTPVHASISADGELGVGVNNPLAQLHVKGDTGQPLLRGDIGSSTVFEVTETGRVVTTALEVTGGGDLVEGFETSDGSGTPGTVMSIDPEHPGRLIASGGAYDTRVAGVVSGAGGVNHGIRMGQDDVLDGDTLLAMTGRVHVRCSTENGPIRPGDRLTTASLTGHAMKVTDSARSVGAVIGKAMSSLDEETGLVLVLVNLQ
jgi:hypothetical protein